MKDKTTFSRRFCALALAAFLLSPLSALAGGIGSAKDLQDFIAAYNNGESLSPWSEGDSIVVLTADIDLGKVKKMAQIENFSGRFDGRGFRLKNWKSATGGLFKMLGTTAVVSNLVIDKSCAMKVSSKDRKEGDFCLGFIADLNEGTIQACVNEGSIAHKCAYAGKSVYIGGIAGANRYVIRECRNSGKITSDVSGEFKEEVNHNVGGITGGAPAKPYRSSVVVNCENTGEISAVSNLFFLFEGGIIGKTNRTNVKYCINRGAVKGDIREGEPDAKTDKSSVGSIILGGCVGQAKGDIVRCDNFGAVTAQGAGGAGIGGIVGAPHAVLVIVDSFNYGEVKALGELPSNAGGIAGQIARPVHVRGCVNYGKIVFDGLSSRARSTAAGIVGNINTPKSQDAGAYVSRCINHGEIFAAAGGNKYDATNKNAIHAGGIVGFADVRKDYRALIADNFNDGKVSCEGGRRGSIAGGTSGVNVTGSAPSDWVTLLDKVSADGSNVRGSVKTPEGKPLEGILVTDGLQYVKTGKDGSYKMTSDLSRTKFIYLSIPDNAQAPTRDGVPQFFRRVPRYAQAVQADFVLEPCSPAKDYTILWIADPQVKPFGFKDDFSMDVWHNRVAPDAEAFRASQPGNVYCINLGDLVYNEMSAWEDYLAGAAKIDCPTFNVIGNHDYDQANLFDTNQGNAFFETYVGPEHYSFDIGDIHYIVLNTILYDRKDAKDKYHYGIDDNTYEWLKADLSHVPHDKILMPCAHNNLFKTPNSSPNGSHGVYNLHYKDCVSLFAPYKAVYSWNGHSHTNFYYNYANHYGKPKAEGGTKHGAPNIQSISVTRATGALRFNAPIGQEGEPQGYMVMNVREGNKVDWYYKGVGSGKNYQMRAYTPETTADGTVKVNVFNWSEGWSTPEWYEGGKKVADMEFTPGIDYAYKALFDEYHNETNRKYCQPSDKCDIFSVTPSAGCRSGQIRVTDLFGNTYSTDVNW